MFLTLKMIVYTGRLCMCHISMGAVCVCVCVCVCSCPNSCSQEIRFGGRDFLCMYQRTDCKKEMHCGWHSIICTGFCCCTCSSEEDSAGRDVLSHVETAFPSGILACALETWWDFSEQQDFNCQSVYKEVDTEVGLLFLWPVYL